MAFVDLPEGPKGVKWELSFGQIFTGRMEFESLGLGIANKKNNGSRADLK